MKKTFSLRSRIPRRTAGLNLIEIAIVAGIAGLLVGAVWAVTAQLRAANQLRFATQELAIIAQGVRTTFAEQPGASGQRAHLTLALDRMTILPMEMRQTANNPTGIIFHPFNQQVSSGLGSAAVFASDCNGAETANDTTAQPCFTITFLLVPKSACIKLAALSPAPNSGAQGVIVNSSGLLPLPVTTSTAASSCNAATNTMSWVYLVKDNS